MQSAELDQTGVDITTKNGDTVLRANGQVMVFDGFLSVYRESVDETADGDGEAGDESGKLLPDLVKGEALTTGTVTPEQHFTQPPPRFTDASLVKRMEELEGIALEHKGVQQAFAIQAGREMRVIVSAEDTDDRLASKVCRDIAQAFEERLTYPGEIKVTVIRESRFIELAR